MRPRLYLMQAGAFGINLVTQSETAADADAAAEAALEAAREKQRRRRRRRAKARRARRRGRGNPEEAPSRRRNPNPPGGSAAAVRAARTTTRARIRRAGPAAGSRRLRGEAEGAEGGDGGERQRLLGIPWWTLGWRRAASATWIASGSACTRWWRRGRACTSRRASVGCGGTGTVRRRGTRTRRWLLQYVVGARAWTSASRRR